MRDASVGFQCPTCVKEGARSTRTGVLPYGGRRARDPRLTTFVIMGLNVLVWISILATGGNSSRLLTWFSLLPKGRCEVGNGYYPSIAEGACKLGGQHWVAGVSDGAVWQLVTSMFTQVQVTHIGFNMLALFFLGPMLEQVLGRTRFLAIYLVSGLLGSAAVMLFSSPQQQTLGASGAIFGLMGALVVVAVKVGGNVQTILFWIGLNLVFTFTAGGISWEGHLGGLVGGLVLGAAIVYAPRSRRVPVQWTAVGLVAVVAIALAAVRAAALG